jgi:hypothetical protein
MGSEALGQLVEPSLVRIIRGSKKSRCIPHYCPRRLIVVPIWRRWMIGGGRFQGQPCAWHHSESVGGDGTIHSRFAVIANHHLVVVRVPVVAWYGECQYGQGWGLCVLYADHLHSFSWLACAAAAAAASATHTGLCCFQCCRWQSLEQKWATLQPPHTQLRPDTNRVSECPTMLLQVGLLQVVGTAKALRAQPVACSSCCRKSSVGFET